MRQGHSVLSLSYEIALFHTTTKPNNPRLELPRLELPRLELPRLELPRLELPRLGLPRLGLPRLELPRLELPRLETLVCRVGPKPGLKAFC